MLFAASCVASICGRCFDSAVEKAWFKPQAPPPTQKLLLDVVLRSTEVAGCVCGCHYLHKLKKQMTQIYFSTC